MNVAASSAPTLLAASGVASPSGPGSPPHRIQADGVDDVRVGAPRGWHRGPAVEQTGTRHRDAGAIGGGQIGPPRELNPCRHAGGPCSKHAVTGHGDGCRALGGVQFTGWTDQPTTDGPSTAVPGAAVIAGGATVPSAWSSDPNIISQIRLYAMWR